MEDHLVQSRYGARSRPHLGSVTVRTSDVGEQRFTNLYRGGDCSPRRWRQEGHEVAELLNVGAVVVEAGLGIECQQSAVALRAVLVGKLRVGDTHFVQVGVTGKLEQGGVLIFPAKFADR